MPIDPAWSGLRSGSQTALKQLYESYASRLLSYGYAHSMDRQLVEDTLQEVFIHLWNTHERLPEVEHVKAYLYTAMRHRLYRKMTYRPKWTEVGDVEEGTFLMEVTVDEEVVNRAPQSPELAASLRAMVDQLSPRQREVVYLKYFEGMDYDEIGEIMELEYQSLRNLMTKAMKRLRKMNMVLALILQLGIGYTTIQHVSTQ